MPVADTAVQMVGDFDLRIMECELRTNSIEKVDRYCSNSCDIVYCVCVLLIFFAVVGSPVLFCSLSSIDNGILFVITPSGCNMSIYEPPNNQIVKIKGNNVTVRNLTALYIQQHTTMEWYLSPFELRPRVIDMENSEIHTRTVDDDSGQPPPPPPIYLRRITFQKTRVETTTYYKDCYPISEEKPCYDPSCAFFSGACIASWHDLDDLGNTSLRKASHDWEKNVGYPLVNMWGYAVATMVVFPLIVVWPIIQIPVISLSLAHINSSPFLCPESWKYLFPTCHVSVQPTANYWALFVSVLLHLSIPLFFIFLFCILVPVVKIAAYYREKALDEITAKRHIRPQVSNSDVELVYA